MSRRPSLPFIALLCLALAAASGCAKSWKQFAYEGFDRESWQHTDRVIETLAIEPGDQIADLGSGSGYFTFALAKATGPDGVVYAVDVDPDMVELVTELAEEKNAGNVRPTLATPDDPKLPEGTIDLVFTSNTYHHLEDPVAYFRKLRSDLDPEGRVAILDLREDSGWFQSWSGHYSDEKRIEEQMREAGYQLVERPTFLERQSFLVFRPT